MALTPEQIPDFVALTQNVVKRGKWTDLSLDLHQGPRCMPRNVCGEVVLEF